MALQQRRKSDSHWPSYLVSGVKAALSFICLGVLGFIGSWGIGVNSTMATLKENILVLQEQERMTTGMVYPQLMDQIKQLRGDIKELRGDLKGKQNARGS